MIIAALLGFAFGFIGSMPFAGPIAVLVVARGVEGRYKSGLGIAIGAGVAEGFYACGAFMGLAELLTRFPLLLTITRVTAVIVLTVLGILFLRYRTTDKPTVEHKEGWGGGVILGFTITALNPTLIATWSAAAATLFASGWIPMDRALALPFGGAAVIGIIGWFALLLYLLKRYRGRFSQRTLDRVIQSMGIFLLGIAGWFIYQLITSL